MGNKRDFTFDIETKASLIRIINTKLEIKLEIHTPRKILRP